MEPLPQERCHSSNLTRWRNEEYDRLWRVAETELDPVKRAAQFIRMNDLVVQNVVVIPVFVRHATFAVANWLRGFDFSPFSASVAAGLLVPEGVTRATHVERPLNPLPGSSAGSARRADRRCRSLR